ncbi:hypothetical protein MAOCGLVR_CDS0046 [Staphylococcus phage PG-2021_68]
MKSVVYLMYKLIELIKFTVIVSVFSQKTQKEVDCLYQMDVFTSYDTFTVSERGHAVFLL